MALYGLVFDHVRSFQLTVTTICVRAKVSIQPRILNDIVIHVVLKGDVFYFIERGRMKNGIVLCESRQDWFVFVGI